MNFGILNVYKGIHGMGRKSEVSDLFRERNEGLIVIESCLEKLDNLPLQ